VEMKQEMGFKQTNDLKLTSASIAFSSSKLECFGHLTWRLALPQNNRYAYAITIVDETGQPLWFGGNYQIGLKPDLTSTSDGFLSVTNSFDAIVPKALAKGQRFYIGLHVFDGKEAKYLTPLEGPLTVKGDVASLATYLVGERDKSSRAFQEHFRLVSESLPDHIRVYENRRALPEAYLVHEIKVVSSPFSALKMAMGDSAFKPEQMVAVELPDPDVKEPMMERLLTLRSPGAVAGEDHVVVKRPNPNEVIIHLTSATRAILTLTDMHYPGWEAYLDGQRVPILHVNCAFRGVLIEPGAHKVEFKYQPLSFLAGCALALTFLLIAATVFLMRRLRRTETPELPDLHKTPEPALSGRK